MALYALFKFTVLCALFQAVAAVRCHSRHQQLWPVYKPAAELGRAALRALRAACRLARRLSLLLRGGLGGGSGRGLLAVGGHDAAQLLARHVGCAVCLHALGALLEAGKGV